MTSVLEARLHAAPAHQRAVRSVDLEILARAAGGREAQIFKRGAQSIAERRYVLGQPRFVAFPRRLIFQKCEVTLEHLVGNRIQNALRGNQFQRRRWHQQDGDDAGVQREKTQVVAQRALPEWSAELQYQPNQTSSAVNVEQQERSAFQLVAGPNTVPVPR